MIKCLIVDDEQLARSLLEGYIKKLPHLSLVGSCKSSLEAMAVLQNETIDLILLDIQMPDLTGIEFLKTLNRKPLIMFTTAYKEYAIEGYELDVIDYLLKPISFERFVQGINKVCERVNSRKQNLPNQTSENIEKKNTNDYLLLKADYKTYRVKYDEIFYIEGLREYVTYYTTQRKIVVLESLKKLEETLPVDTFLRVHKSFIVNTNKVKSLYGNQLEVDGKYIPIGKTYLESVKAKLFSV